jgi:hypothetical protein
VVGMILSQSKSREINAMVTGMKRQRDECIAFILRQATFLSYCIRAKVDSQNVWLEGGRRRIRLYYTHVQNGTLAGN